MTSVDVAPAVGRMRRFLEWVGSGQPLTQTGRIRRADAITLVQLLDTGDLLDRRYPIQSSSELPQLELLVEWAKRCRLVRVVRGRLLVVSKNAGMLDRPAALVPRMLEALPGVCAELGHSVVMADAERTVGAVLEDLVGRGSVPEERACEIAWATAMRRFWFPDATDSQLEFQRRRGDGDLRWVLATLRDLGVLTVADRTITPTASGRRCLRAWLGLGSPAADRLWITVSLEESASPVIWRRLSVPGDLRLDRLHQVLVAAMGWQDSHLHVFERGDDRYGFADPDLDVQDEQTMTVGGVLVDPGDRIDYEYDFGDCWRHAIVLDSVAPADPDDGRAHVADGAGRCPPEDVGGVPGYEDLKAVLADPHDDAYAEMLGWLGLEDGDAFDPLEFALEQAEADVASVPANRFL